MNYFHVQLERIVGAARRVAARQSYGLLLLSHRPEYFDADELAEFAAALTLPRKDGLHGRFRGLGL